MIFFKGTKKSKYVKAKTPQTIKKQKAAIVDYYVKKRETEQGKPKPKK